MDTKKTDDVKVNISTKKDEEVKETNLSEPSDDKIISISLKRVLLEALFFSRL